LCRSRARAGHGGHAKRAAHGAAPRPAAAAGVRPVIAAAWATPETRPSHERRVLLPPIPFSVLFVQGTLLESGLASCEYCCCSRQYRTLSFRLSYFLWRRAIFCTCRTAGSFKHYKLKARTTATQQRRPREQARSMPVEVHKHHAESIPKL
jgi:hypothetical protein